MINVFIGLSNNHLSSCELVLRKQDTSKSYNVLISNSTLKFKKTLWNEIILSEKTFNNQPKGQVSSLLIIIKKIKQYKRIIREVQKFKNEQKITLYFFYIEDILTNYLLLSFNKKLKGIVIEDGTLNYYSHTIKNIPKIKRYLKWILSNILGIRFKIYKGHSSGIQYEHVKKQLVRIPELTLFPDKSEKLEFPIRGVRLSETILIIGQEPYINMYGITRYNESIVELISIINKNPDLKEIKTIYYKPHRHGQRVNYERLYSQLKEKSLEILDSDSPLEDLYFNKLGSKYIYSFDSSAMLNIYLELPLELKSEVKFNVLLKYNELLKPVFEKFNFKIYT